MPANKRVRVSTLPKAYESGTHSIDPVARPRTGLGSRFVPRPLPGTALRRAEPDSIGDWPGASPEIEVQRPLDTDAGLGVKIHATVDAECDGCGVVVEVELSQFLESSAVACPGCLDVILQGWGKALDRPTIEFTPSSALLCASRRPLQNE